MKAMRLLAAGAVLALVAGVPAESRVGPVVKATVAKKRSGHVAVGRRLVVRFEPKTPASVALPAPEPVAGYRWLDGAQAMLGAVGDGAPDFSFAEAGNPRYAWRLRDGGLVVLEVLGPGDGRYFFYEADSIVPFLVRDRLYAFAFEHGRMTAVYDDAGRVVGAPNAWQRQASTDLFARGRELWFAAQRPPAPVRMAAPVVINIDLAGDFGGWQRSDGWRQYRRGPGAERWRAREGRDRREREARAGRTWRGPEGGRTDAGEGASRPTPERSVERASGPTFARPDRRQAPWSGKADRSELPVPATNAPPLMVSPDAARERHDAGRRARSAPEVLAMAPSEPAAPPSLEAPSPSPAPVAVAPEPPASAPVQADPPAAPAPSAPVPVPVQADPPAAPAPSTPAPSAPAPREEPAAQPDEVTRTE